MIDPTAVHELGSIEKGPDLTVRVRRVSIEGFEFIDIREYVPSSETYGRGIMVPAGLKKPLLQALMHA